MKGHIDNMSNILSKLLGLILLTGLLLMACGEGASRKSRAELLTRTAWKYEMAGFDSNQDGYIDVLDPKIADCESDDIIRFNSDGTGSFNIGGIKCDPSDPPSLPFMWSFENKENVLFFQEQHFKIKTLSDSRLEMFTYQYNAGISTKYMIVLKH
jgi:hypothetical protein